MSDIQTTLTSDGINTLCDYRLQGGDFAEGDDIKTAVILSLFSDRRAEQDDLLPSEADSRRGWWGDAFAARRLGSRLWLLGREKDTQAVIARAREYAREALQWLIEDGIASALTVETEALKNGALGLFIAISRPRAAPARYRFDFAWRKTP